jgi:hypothetical protein
MRSIPCLCLSVILALALAPPPLPAQAKYQQPLVPTFLRAGGSQTIAADIFDTIVYLPVRVNGQGPYSFILDTGNGGPPIVNEKLARKLGIPLGQKLNISGAGAKEVDLYLVDKADLALPGLEYPAAPSATLPLDLMDPHWGKHKDGLLGSTVFASLVTDIDYAARTVRFIDPGVFVPPTAGVASTVPMEVFGQPFVTAKVYLYGTEQPVEAFMMIDTGVRITTFNAPFSRKNGLAAQSPRTLATMTGCGIGGESWGVVGRVRAMEIGPFRFENPVVDFSTDEGGSLASDQFAGIIGADLLHRFHVVFDFPGKRMLLEKNAAFTEPFEYDMIGWRLVAEGGTFDVIKVFHVAEKTPAAEAGLLAGDEIVSIDGRPAAGFGWEKLRAYFRRPGEKVRLEIRRGDRKLALDVTLRPLV